MRPEVHEIRMVFSGSRAAADEYHWVKVSPSGLCSYCSAEACGAHADAFFAFKGI